jgi:hypothetical protein
VSSDGRAEAGDRIPIESVLGSMGVHPLEEGAEPLEAVLLIKFVDAQGETCWSYRTTHRPNLEELLGVLTLHRDRIRHVLKHEWE